MVKRGGGGLVLQYGSWNQMQTPFISNSKNTIIILAPAPYLAALPKSTSMIHSGTDLQRIIHFENSGRTYSALCGSITDYGKNVLPPAIHLSR